jgi:hypothetical protein
VDFEEWRSTEEGRLVSEAIRDHVSMVSRDVIETALKAAYLAGAQAGRRESAFARITT